MENVFQRGSRPDVFHCGASRAGLMGHFRGSWMIASARVKGECGGRVKMCVAG